MKKSREEIVAGKIADLLSDLRLNLDLVGTYISRHRPFTNYNRLQEIADSAYYARVGNENSTEEISDDIEERFKQYAQQD